MPPTSTKATATSVSVVMTASHFDLRQAPDDQEANDLEGEPGAQEHRCRRRLDQWIEVSRRQEVEDDREQHRAEPDEDRGVPLLGGQHAGMAQQLAPLADDVAETVEELGQVSTGASLNPHGVAEELYVLERDPLVQTRQGLTGVDTEADLLGDVAELLPDGIAHLLADHLDGSAQRVAGPDRARDHLHCVREVLLESLDPAVSLEHEPQHRRRATQQTCEHRPADVAEAPPAERRAHEGTGADDEQH